VHDRSRSGEESGGGSGGWQRHRECCSNARRRGYGDLTTVTKYGVSGNRETESGPAASHSPRATIDSFHREEALEDARKVGAVNANAVINHGDLRSAIAQPINLQFNTAALAAVLHGVMDKIGHRLA